jgi:hypothetical protein
VKSSAKASFSLNLLHARVQNQRNKPGQKIKDNLFAQKLWFVSNASAPSRFILPLTMMGF